MRYKQGADHPQARVTEDEVRQLLALLDTRKVLRKKIQRLSDKALADQFNVSTSYVAKLAAGVLWPHIDRTEI